MLTYFHRHPWKYKNTTLLLLSIIVFFFLAETPFVKEMISSIGEWGYAGAVLTGIFSVMTFTAAPALTVLYYLSDKLNPIELSLLAGLGSVIGDFTLFKFFKDSVFKEFEPIVERLSHSPISHIFKSKYFLWLTPVIGAVIIASPLPDELGVSLLSIGKMTRWRFILLSFLLNSIGIFIIITGTRAILE